VGTDYGCRLKKNPHTKIAFELIQQVYALPPFFRSLTIAGWDIFVVAKTSLRESENLAVWRKSQRSRAIETRAAERQTCWFSSNARVDTHSPCCGSRLSHVSKWHHPPICPSKVGVTKALSTRLLDTMAIPDGAACYFCLGEEGDDSRCYATAHVVVTRLALPTYHA
jgi:hypothetical protein